MNCPNCGTANLENARICVNCGRPLYETAAPPPPTPPPQQASYTPPPPSQASYQPPHTGAPPPVGPVVPNYLWQSIVVTLCCCLPFGIVAIIFAAQVNQKLAAGDYAGAVHASKQAKMWALIGFILGLVGIVIYMLMGGLAVFDAWRQSNM